MNKDEHKKRHKEFEDALPQSLRYMWSKVETGVISKEDYNDFLLTVESGYCIDKVVLLNRRK